MKHFYLLLFAIAITITAQGQIKFKPQLEIAVSKDNFYLYNNGLAIEKKIEIDKSIQTGIFHHSFEFNFPKTKYGFYDAFIKGTPNDAYRDSITDIRVVFKFFSIPVGFSKYITPKTYLTYKLGFNFFTSSSYQGFYTENADYSVTGSAFQAHFPSRAFKKFYTNSHLGINTIILRRFDIGMSFIFTKSNFFKKTDSPIYNAFNKEVSRYFAVGFNIKYFLFQINSKKL